MNNNSSPRVVKHRGLTLLELTVVITVLLSLVTILFIGAKAWKRGSDRAGCILTLRSIQVATRSYQNMYNYNYGGRPYAEGGTQDIAEHLYAKGYIEEKVYKQTRGNATCMGGGTYTCAVPDVFPPAGTLYLDCSLSATQSHVPTTHDDW